MLTPADIDNPLQLYLQVSFCLFLVRFLLTYIMTLFHNNLYNKIIFLYFHLLRRDFSLKFLTLCLLK